MSSGMEAHRKRRCGIEVIMEHLQVALTGHGIWVVLGLVLASGAGLPLPAPPVLLAAGVLAGAGRLPLVEFALYGGAGSLLWAAAFVLPGYLFSERISRAAPIGEWVAAAASLAFAGWLGWKVLQRRRYLQVGRVTPDELFGQLESGR